MQFKFKKLELPDVVLIEAKAFVDERGYFVETYKHTDFAAKGISENFVQVNHSYSRSGTVRGLHYQKHPKAQGKLVMVIKGKIFDVALDIRKSSPTYGRWVAVLLSSKDHRMLYVPPGFAHGSLFIQESLIEYFCTSQYNPHCEASISLYAKDIDWSFCDPSLREIFKKAFLNTNLITEKDRNGLDLKTWQKDERSNHFQ